MKNLRERLKTMTPEELRRGARAAAWGDRTHRAAQLAQFDDDRDEALQVLLECWDALAKAAAELGLDTGHTK